MFVEHDMDVVADISDWVIVMSEGIIIAEGPPSTIGANPAVQDAYLGSAHAALTEEIQEIVAEIEEGSAHTVDTHVDHDPADAIDTEDDGDG
jgi:branched-chain amino acid transport system ATP-binding protein